MGELVNYTNIARDCGVDAKTVAEFFQILVDTYPGKKELRGLHAFMDEHKPKKSILVCQEKKPRVTEDGIYILPWQVFLDQLWGGDITS